MIKSLLSIENVHKMHKSGVFGVSMAIKVLQISISKLDKNKSSLWQKLSDEISLSKLN